MDMTIKDCVPYITSDDYRARIIGEYHELNIRRKKLGAMIQKHKAGLLEFDLHCPVKILEIQYNAMCEYEDILVARMQIEGIAE